jgi:hypothetical protein
MLQGRSESLGVVILTIPVAVLGLTVSIFCIKSNNIFYGGLMAETAAADKGLLGKLIHSGWSIYDKQKEIIDEEAHARRYSSSSALVRDIFQAWIDDNHSTKRSSTSSGVSEK